MNAGTRVKLRTPGLNAHHVVKFDSIAKYYGIENDKKIEGIITKCNINKTIDWVGNNGIEQESTTISHQCAVLWDNGCHNVFNFNNLKRVFD